MRRPVKPFVTEYKGPSRRSASPSGGHPRRSSDDGAPFLAPGEGFARIGGDAPLVHHHAEDAYEAALRAADALFAPLPRASAAARESDAPDSGSAPTIPPSEASSPIVSSPSIFGATAIPDAEDAKPGTERGADAENLPRGRILRVLDEPPVPGLADLEVERAPKRRGRKPGSKNKPKPVIVAAPPASASSEATAAAAAAALARIAELVSSRTASSPPALSSPSITLAARSSASTAAPDPVSSAGTPSQASLSPQASASPVAPSRRTPFDDKGEVAAGNPVAGNPVASNPVAEDSPVVADEEEDDAFFPSWEREAARPDPAWGAPPRPAPARPAAAPVVSSPTTTTPRAEP